jgi:hypothetical protein
MSHDAINRCAKSRTTERGPPSSGPRDRVGRRRRSSVAQFWVIASSGLSLPRRGRGDRPSRSHRRTVGSDHAEDSGQRRARSPQLFGSQRTDAWRNCRACHLEVPQSNAPDEGFSGASLVRPGSSGCAIWLPRGSLRPSSSTLPTGSAANTPTRYCSPKSLPAMALRPCLSRRRHDVARNLQRDRNRRLCDGNGMADRRGLFEVAIGLTTR